MTSADVAAVIRERFRTLVAEPEGVVVAHDNAEFSPPDGGKWVRLSMVDGDSTNIEATGPVRHYRTVGVAIAAIHVPLNAGDAQARALAAKVVTAFRATTVSGVLFSTPSERVAGRERERWWRHDVVIPFQWDDAA